MKIMGKTGGWKVQDCLELQRGQVLQRIKKIETVRKRGIGQIGHNKKSIKRDGEDLEIIQMA